MSRALAMILLIASFSICSPAFAGSATMLKLLQVLHENGTLDTPTYKLLVDALLEEEAGKVTAPNTVQPAPDRVTETASAEPKKTMPEQRSNVEYEGGGLRAVSADGQYQSIFNGYFQLDAARYNETGVPLGDGGEVRRARLTWRGLIGDSWLFRTSLDFADGANIRSTYIDYRPTDASAIRFGSFKEPFGMEELSSARYLSFMERALVRALTPRRSFGLGYNTSGSHHSLRMGAFIEDTDDETDPGWSTTGRITSAPWVEKTRVLHLGLSGTYREMKEGNTVRFRSRPESHVTDVRFVDTGQITDGESQFRLGLEGAMVLGPWSLQGEYMRADIDRRTSPDLGFDGWYTYGSWIVTGESREYDVGNGRFRRIRPARPLRSGGAGAWELALRYSNLDLNDEDIIGGEEDNVTFAINWYPHKDIRFSVNYVDVLDVKRPGSEFDGENPDIFQVRGQIQF